MSSEPPQQLVNQELERALLGGLLRNPAHIEHLGDFSPESYAVEWHATIHRCLAENPGGGAIALMKTIALNDPELRKYIAGLFEAVIIVRSTDLREYARQVTDLHRRRGLVQVADQLRQDAFSPDAEMTTALALARGLDGLDAVSVVGPGTSSSHSFDDALQSAMQAANDAAHGRGISGVATGFPSIDSAIGGLEAGNLTILAGRPGMGKTALGWQIAVSAARSGVGTLFVSLEMSSKELGRRALAFTAGVPVGVLKNGTHSDPEAGRLVQGQQALYGLPLTIEDGAGLTPALIGAKARAAQRRHGLGLLVVDHLHIVEAAEADRRHGPTHAVGSISTALKRLAKELGVAVLLLAQLNRGVEGRDDRRPTLADLRQSGTIEQDADVVMLLYRPEYYLNRSAPERTACESDSRWQARTQAFADQKTAAAGAVELILAKVRDGATGTISLAFDGATTSFRDTCHAGH